MIKERIPIEKNSQYEVEIDGWSSDGNGVAHIDGYAVFIPFTIVGERWIIKIVKVSSSAIYGKALQLLLSSEHRVSPICENFGKCGGCHTLHMTYSKELEYKLNVVNNTLRHVGGLNFQIDQIYPSDLEFRYRNKSICAVGEDANQVKCGFYKKRTHEIIPIKQCFLQSERADRVNNVITTWLNNNKFKAYNEENGKGTVRHIFTRSARYTEDFVVCIISARGFGNKTHDLIDFVVKECPFVTGIVLNINKSRGNTILSGDFHTLWGDPYIHDSLNGIQFQIAPQAFYQVNPLQAEKMYNKISEFAHLSGNETVIDLYCGTGTIGLTLAGKAKKVFGIEIVPEAIENAIENANYNGISNISFVCSDASESILLELGNSSSPDVVVVDPPRKGLSSKVIKMIFEINPSKIIYVSCNPSTLARDLALMQEHYDITQGCSFDMFPRTNHVETVVLMSQVKG